MTSDLVGSSSDTVGTLSQSFQPVQPLAVYVHIPFCPTKCGYCDFNSYAGTSDSEVSRTVQAQVEEIRQSPWRGRAASTIFFGGGTPTFLSEYQLLSIFEAVVDTHPPVADCEITSEANPGTVDAEKFAAMHRAGFNRVSLGAQSFLDTDLVALGRIHRSGEIERAVDLARSAGFDNLNLDLMFGLPYQSMRAWKANLERALKLQPEHLSLYCLTLEPNTPFYKRHLSGDLEVPDDEQQVAMYDACIEGVKSTGFDQYEISNYAKANRACQHNLAYWTGVEYAGYGPGAVGCVQAERGRRRYTNLKLPSRFAAAIENRDPQWFEEEILGSNELRTEEIMLGLRLNQGIALDVIGTADRGLEQLVARGWAEVIGSRVALTSVGRHFCSEAALLLI